MLVTTYSELGEFVDMFAKQYIDLLIVKGDPGLGKTHTIRNIMKNYNHVYINTHITPLSAYILLYNNRDRPVIIDDIDALLNNEKLVSLLKQAGETVKEKTLQWHSTKLPEEIEPEFKTRSNLLIVCNDINTKRVALFDRGFQIEFRPSKEEVLRKLEEITEIIDLEGKYDVLNLIKKFYDFSEKVNLRTLIKGFQLRRYGNSWENKLLREMNIHPKLILVYELLQKYDKVEDAVREYPYSRSDFFNWKKKLGGGVDGKV